MGESLRFSGHTADSEGDCGADFKNLLKNPNKRVNYVK